MNSIDVYTPKIRRLLQSEKERMGKTFSLDVGRLEPVSVELVDADSYCSQTERKQEGCFVVEGEAEPAVKIIYRGAKGSLNAGKIFTVYDKKISEDMLAELSQAEAFTHHLDQAVQTLFESGMGWNELIDARVKMVQEFACNCLTDVSTEGLQEEMFRYLKIMAYRSEPFE